MINRNEVVQNNHCTVSYSYWQQGVIVQKSDLVQQRIFGGYPTILIRYRELADNFNDEIDFETACNWFTLNIKEYEAHQPQ